MLLNDVPLFQNQLHEALDRVLGRLWMDRRAVSHPREGRFRRSVTLPAHYCTVDAPRGAPTATVFVTLGGQAEHAARRGCQGHSMRSIRPAEDEFYLQNNFNLNLQLVENS